MNASPLKTLLSTPQPIFLKSNMSADIKFFLERFSSSLMNDDSIKANSIEELVEDIEKSLKENYQ